MLTRKQEPPRDPNEWMIGTCATCRTTIEAQRKNTSRSHKDHWRDVPSVACGCGARIYLTVKPAVVVQEFNEVE